MLQLKNALATLIATTMSIDKALNDNHITPLEWAQIAIKSIGFWRVVKDFEEIKQQIASLTPDDKTELLQFVQSEFDLRNDDLEQTIEKAFGVLIEFSALINLFPSPDSVDSL
jgi:hypothetical protein